MTPKEKAKELVDKFYQTTPYEAFIDEPCGIGAEYKAWEQAKECALIAVDEINNNVLVGIDLASTWGNYWQQVKTEIENL